LPLLYWPLLAYLAHLDENLHDFPHHRPRIPRFSRSGIDVLAM
jgi:hypothetical protein